MKKLIFMLVVAVMLALFAPVYAAEPVTREVGDDGRKDDDGACQILV